MMRTRALMWRKLGRVYVADGARPWAQTHAYLPTAVRHDGGRVRVYAAFLDASKVGRVGFVDVDASDPSRVLRVSETPSLDIGEPGAFDDNGVTPSSIVDHDGRRYLYYIGWQLGVRTRYHLFNGLAISEDGGDTFTRVSKVPVTDRANGEAVIRSAAHVRLDDGVWKMWYVAGNRWVLVNGSSVPTYDIRYLESADGVSWGASGKQALELRPPDEYGLGRPCAVREADGWAMWYSVRTISKGYRLGYAESADGRSWERKDDRIGIDVSAHGWDSEMICFSNVLTIGDRTYLFYNGNRHGETGFGVAVAER